jgi:hypothetical protein
VAAARRIGRLNVAGQENGRGEAVKFKPFNTFLKSQGWFRLWCEIQSWRLVSILGTALNQTHFGLTVEKSPSDHL